MNHQSEILRPLIFNKVRFLIFKYEEKRYRQKILNSGYYFSLVVATTVNHYINRLKFQET